MVFPPIVAIGDKDVIKNHRAQAQHDDLSNVANIECGVETVSLERLPSQPILIAKSRYLLTQDVAKKPELEAFVKSVGGNDDFFVVLEQQDLTTFGINIELQHR